MIEQDQEYYQRLQKELTSHRRWFYASLCGFAFCLGAAFDQGPNAGWDWLLGSLAALMVALCAKIEEQHTSVLIRIYLASVK